MRIVLLPFFILRLLVSLIPFSLELLLVIIKPYFGLVFFLVLMSLYLVSFITSLEKTTLPSNEIIVSNAIKKSPTEIKIDEIQQKLFKTNQVILYQDDPRVNSILNQLFEFNKTIPYHRDVLLNLAIIEAEKNNLETAQKYLQKIEYSDPNNSKFK